MTTPKQDHARIVATSDGPRLKLTHDGQTDYLDADGHVYQAPAGERLVRDLGLIDAADDRDFLAALEALRSE